MNVNMNSVSRTSSPSPGTPVYVWPANQSRRAEDFLSTRARWCLQNLPPDESPSKHFCLSDFAHFNSFPPQMNLVMRPLLTRSPLLSPASVCSNPDNSPVLLVMVTSAVTHTEERDAIRQSWARVTRRYTFYNIYCQNYLSNIIHR